MTPKKRDVVHMVKSSEGGVATATCGVTVKTQSRPLPTLGFSSWWRTVTCPECLPPADTLF